MGSQSSRQLGLVIALSLSAACGDSNPHTDRDTDSNPVDEERDGGSDDDSELLDARAPNIKDSSAARADARTSDSADASKSEPTQADDAGGVQTKADGATPTPTAGGACCDDGNCLCHGPDPDKLTSAAGPYKTQSYSLDGTGCVFYPTDAEPPFAAVTVADGFGGSGGCGFSQTGQWGPLYASWGIVTMIVTTNPADQPNARGAALSKGIAAFKTENTKAGSPLQGKLAGRYGTSGFSMGGGGTTYAAQADSSLLTDVAIMPWGPVTSGVSVPTLVICGSSDTTAPCTQYGTKAYAGIASSVPKMRVQITSGHAGQPTSGSGKAGEYGLAFQKVFLENDQRWRPLLVAATSEETNIK